MQKSYITPDIVEAKTMENYQIYLKFKNGEEKILDMNILIQKYPRQYNRLKEKEYFNKIKIENGMTIVWEMGEDIAPEILYYDSKSINKKQEK